MNFNLNFQKWAVATTRMKRGEEEASSREKFEAVLPGLNGYVLERDFLNSTDASSLDSGVEKPRKKKRVMKPTNRRTFTII